MVMSLIYLFTNIFIHFVQVWESKEMLFSHFWIFIFTKRTAAIIDV